MKKYLFVLLIVSFFASCEKDDICIDETTPHLVIRFYDKTSTSTVKAVTNLKVEVENSNDEFVQIGNTASLDSIVLPLNVDFDLTKIRLTKNFSETSAGIVNAFTLNYNREEVFVSRSCGYKTIYRNVNKSDENLSSDWIQNINLLFPDIDNENQAHITIFH
jgi:hypothetical protein